MTQDLAPDSSGSAALPAPGASRTDAERGALDWLAGWGAEVAAVRLDAARSRFAPDVTGFGTYADVVVGLDALHADQWSRVWPTIEDFAFRLDETVVLLSPDELQAVLIAPWTSTGIAADSSRFDRPGRATVVLRREAPGAPWRGVHTHFSLGRGIPQQSHGRRDPAPTEG